MNFKGDFRQLGSFELSDLKTRILQFTEEDWSRNDLRQKKFETHKDTKTIPLIFDEDMRHENPTFMPEYKLLESQLKPLYAFIKRHYNKSLKYKRLQKKHGNAYPIRTILARLRPNGSIRAHMDRNHTLTHGHRIHIPIVTDKSVYFSVGENTQYLEEGEVWEINNRHIHQVENKSEIHRIHIIIDWVIPGERCCCSIETDPHGSCSPNACKNTDFRNEPCNCFI